MTSSASHPTISRPDLVPGLLAALRIVMDVQTDEGGQERSIQALLILLRMARGEVVES